MPAYNAEKTLQKTYDEIPKDIVDEIILTDDASNDKTVKLKNFYKRSITKNIRETLIDIQNENIKDPFGWVLPLE